MTRALNVALLLVALLLSASVCAAPVAPEDVKERTEALPTRLLDVGIDEKLGEALPLEAQLQDSDGRPVKLGDFFDGVHPVLLTFNYSDCPMLCSLQLNKLVGGMRQLKRSVGDEFRLVTISIDPQETAVRASETKARYLKAYGREGAALGWSFLTASESTVRDIAASVGFRYSFNEARKEWLHTAAVMVLTPTGTLARYLYGLEYHPDTLELSLVEASAGKIASTLDRLILYCFHYDETEGRYAPVAMNIMRVGAGLVAVALAAFMAFYWLGERRKLKLRALPLARVTAS